MFDKIGKISFFRHLHKVIIEGGRFDSLQFQIVFMTMLLKKTHLLLLCLPFTVSSSEVSDDKVVSKFKAPNESTPPELVKEWAEKDASLRSYIEEIVPAVLDHNGDAAFDEHLKGVQAILRHWEAPEYLSNAGLFHSIYGTEAFQGFALPVSERDAIRTLIGEKAEKLAWVFCMLDRWSLDQQLLQWNEGDDLKETYHLLSRPELGRFPMEISTQEFMDFVELSLADFIEQVSTIHNHII